MRIKRRGGVCRPSPAGFPAAGLNSDTAKAPGARGSYDELLPRIGAWMASGWIKVGGVTTPPDHVAAMTGCGRCAGTIATSGVSAALSSRYSRSAPRQHHVVEADPRRLSPRPQRPGLRGNAARWLRALSMVCGVINAERASRTGSGSRCQLLQARPRHRGVLLAGDQSNALDRSVVIGAHQRKSDTHSTRRELHLRNRSQSVHPRP